MAADAAATVAGGCGRSRLSKSIDSTPSVGLFRYFSSDLGRQLLQNLNYTHLPSRRGFECYGLVYIRGCQEHFSPSTGGAGMIRAIQPLSPWKTLVWCRTLGLDLVVPSRGIFFSSDDADQL